MIYEGLLAEYDESKWHQASSDDAKDFDSCSEAMRRLYKDKKCGRRFFYSNSSSKDKICGCVEDEDRTNLIRVEAPKMDEYYFVEGIFLTNNRLSKL